MPLEKELVRVAEFAFLEADDYIITFAQPGSSCPARRVRLWLVVSGFSRTSALLAASIVAALIIVFAVATAPAARHGKPLAHHGAIPICRAATGTPTSTTPLEHPAPFEGHRLEDITSAEMASPQPPSSSDRRSGARSRGPDLWSLENLICRSGARRDQSSILPTAAFPR